MLTPRKITPAQPVPDHIKKPPYADTSKMPPWSAEPQIHDEEVRIA